MPQPFRTTTSCLLPEPLIATELWCEMAGHWDVTDHQLLNREIPESVLLLCIKGSGFLQVRDRRYEVKVGQVMFCPAGVRHSYGCHQEGWEIYWTHFSGAQGVRLCHLAGLSAENPIMTPSTHLLLLDRLQTLVHTSSQHTTEAAWLAAEALHSLLLGLVRLAHKQENSLASLVHDHCDSLDELVARSGYSRFHFCRLFKQETGLSPWQYILQRRIIRAKELLLSTNQSIKQIATHLQFDHADYFARVFTRYVGVTPRKFRGQVKKG